MTDDWPQIKARLEFEAEGMAQFTAIAHIASDIRAALQRENEASRERDAFVAVLDPEGHNVVTAMVNARALRQRVEEQREQLRKSHERTLYLSQKLMESECHNVRGEDGPCDCVGCQDVAALRQRVEELEQSVATKDTAYTLLVNSLRDDALTFQKRAEAAEARVEELEQHYQARQEWRSRLGLKNIDQVVQENEALNARAEAAESKLAICESTSAFRHEEIKRYQAKLARVVGTLKQIAGDGCGMCTKKDEPCHKLFVREDDWCWCCIARKALDDLTSAKGEK